MKKKVDDMSYKVEQPKPNVGGREWTIYKDEGYDHYCEDVTGPNTERVKVVEASTYASALEEIERLRSENENQRLKVERWQQAHGDECVKFQKETLRTSELYEENARLREALEPLNAYSHAMQDDFEKYNWVTKGEFSGMRPEELLSLAVRRALAVARKALTQKGGGE